jgi:hypothetical protein
MKLPDKDHWPKIASVITSLLLLIGVLNALAGYVQKRNGDVPASQASESRSKSRSAERKRHDLSPEFAARLRAKEAGLPKYYSLQTNGVEPDGMRPLPTQKSVSGYVSFVMHGTGTYGIPSRTGGVEQAYCYKVETYSWSPQTGKGTCVARFFRVERTFTIPLGDLELGFGKEKTQAEPEFVRSHDLTVRSIPDSGDLAVIGTFQPGCEYLNYTGKFKAFEGIP